MKGAKMTLEEAKKIIGNRPRWEIKAIVKALGFHPWLNNAAETKRLEAGKILLNKKGKK